MPSTHRTPSLAVCYRVSGKRQRAAPDSPSTQWVDVRDVALAHVSAIEIPQASGRRIITVAGYTSNEQVAAIVARECSDVRNKLPASFGTTLDGKIVKVDT